MFSRVAVCSHAAQVLPTIPLVHCSPFMNRYCICKLIWLTALGSAGLNVPAGEAEATNALPTTLDTLVAETLAKNPELRFYEGKMAAQKAARKTAGLQANPKSKAKVGENP